MQTFKAVYLIMGEKCNFNCRYCLQHNLFTTPCSSDIDDRIFAYLNNLSPDKDKILFMFWGGEPLLYIDTIRLFVGKLNKDKFNFSIVSNGELLDEDIVNFINENNINFTLSNDGKETANFRTRNMLESESFVKLLKEINGTKSVASVISAQNYKVDSIWEYVSEKIGGHVYINYDYIMDTGSTPKDLTNFNFAEFEEYMATLFNGFQEKIVNNTLTYNEAVYLNSIIKKLVEEYVSGSTPCGTTVHTLNIDCMGNSYLCHNSGIKLGNVLKQNYDEIIKEFNDKYNKYSIGVCVHCEAVKYCRSGCVLVGREARSRYYCDMKKVLHKNLAELIKFVGEL